jgi:hypothetical protein
MGNPRIGRPALEGNPAPSAPPKFLPRRTKPPATVRPTRGPNRPPRTGLRAAKSRLFLRGLAVLDKRTATARLYVTTRQALLDHLGGPEAVSETQAQVVELLVRGLLYIGHVDAVLLERRTLLNKKKTKLLPLVSERMRMAEGLTRQLQILGLERRTNTLDLAQALRSFKWPSTAASSSNGRTSELAHDTTTSESREPMTSPPPTGESNRGD